MASAVRASAVRTEVEGMVVLMVFWEMEKKNLKKKGVNFWLNFNDLCS